MRLALVSPLPPQESPAAGLALRLLASLGAKAQVSLLPSMPELVDRVGLDLPLRPCADLPHLMAANAIDLPIYLVADGPLHAHQLRYVREHPGVLVLLSTNLHQTAVSITEAAGDRESYRRLLVEEYGEQASRWPERLQGLRDPERVRRRLRMCDFLCRPSQAVIVATSLAERLQARLGATKVIGVDLEDAESVARAILDAARQAIANPRPRVTSPQGDWPTAEVLIVGYNCKRIIRSAIESIQAQDYPGLRCTLVDNASTDGTAEFVEQNFPGVHVLRSPKNLGFSGGNNLGFRQSKAKYIVLFNQDAIAHADFVRELVRVAERDDKIAAVGAKMLMLRCPSIINSTGIVMNEGGFAVDRQIGEKDVDPSPTPERVLGACGGAKLIRRSVLDHIGGFDDSFFMYCEDVDLCWRMRLAGYEVMYAPLAVVLHDWFGDLDQDTRPSEDQSQINQKTLRRRFLCERNRMQCVIKNLEGPNLRRVLRQLRQYDKGRLEYIERAITEGRDVDYLKMVAKAIRTAWRWCVFHSPQLWARRRRVQRLRQMSDADLSAFIDRGVGEPTHVGDLSIIQDAASALGSDRLLMGRTDRQALGPGWYEVERVPDQDWDLRWSKGDAWFYLSAKAPATKLLLRLSAGPVPTDLLVAVGGAPSGPIHIHSQDMTTVSVALSEPIDAREVVEVHLRCPTFRPSEVHGNNDHRSLGIRLAEAWFE